MAKPDTPRSVISSSKILQNNSPSPFMFHTISSKNRTNNDLHHWINIYSSIFYTLKKNVKPTDFGAFQVW